MWSQNVRRTEQAQWQHKPDFAASSPHTRLTASHVAPPILCKPALRWAGLRTKQVHQKACAEQSYTGQSKDLGSRQSWDNMVPHTCALHHDKPGVATLVTRCSAMLRAVAGATWSMKRAANRAGWVRQADQLSTHSQPVCGARHKQPGCGARHSQPGCGARHSQHGHWARHSAQAASFNCCMVVTALMSMQGRGEGGRDDLSDDTGKSAERCTAVHSTPGNSQVWASRYGAFSTLERHLQAVALCCTVLAR
eukprot:264972-Chlamydomonas_euryale.AAC.6